MQRGLLNILDEYLESDNLIDEDELEIVLMILESRLDDLLDLKQLSALSEQELTQRILALTALKDFEYGTSNLRQRTSNINYAIQRLEKELKDRRSSKPAEANTTEAPSAQDTTHEWKLYWSKQTIESIKRKISELKAKTDSRSKEFVVLLRNILNKKLATE